jgi:hypothetical protein
MLSGSRRKGVFSPLPPSSVGRVDARVKAASTLYLPLFVICRTLELIYLKDGSVALCSGSFLINSGPKSNTFSVTTKVLESKLSAGWGGLLFLWVINTFLKFELIVGNSQPAFRASSKVLKEPTISNFKTYE